MRIIGIDPGYGTIGFGILDYQSNRFTPVEFGAITTAPDLPFSQRLCEIYDAMVYLLKKHSPEVMAVEELFFTNNRTTGIGVAQARGVILLAGQQHGLPLFEYKPNQVKQAVVGYGNATKQQMMDMTQRLLHLDTRPRPDDAADALAIAIAHAHSAGSLLGAVQQKLPKVSELPANRNYQRMVQAALAKEPKRTEK